MPMNKRALMAVIISFLLVSVPVTSLVSSANANPMIVVSGVPRISLLSPQPPLYKENEMTLSFSGNNVDWGTLEYSKFKYWLDGELKGPLDTALRATEVFSFGLTGLEDGKHTVEVTATVTVKSLTVFYGGITADVRWGNSAQTSSGVLNFTVDTHAPNLSIISPQNSLFQTADVPLNFTVSEPVSAISYSLDENSNVTFTDDVTVAHIFGKDNYYFVLNGLEEGSHSLKIYAKDAAGYTGESDIYYFTVNTQPTPTSGPPHTPTQSTVPSKEPLLKTTQTPNLPEVMIVDYPPLTEYFIIFGIIALIIILVTGTVYLKKRKTQKTILFALFLSSGLAWISS
jgi:hypothetical protein